jgi:hypothetical protein
MRCDGSSTSNPDTTDFKDLSLTYYGKDADEKTTFVRVAPRVARIDYVDNCRGGMVFTAGTHFQKRGTQRVADQH